MTDDSQIQRGRDRNAAPRYAVALAERRLVAHVEQLAQFGHAVGGVFALTGGFCWMCVVSRLDPLWLTMLLIGLILIALGTLLPELLERPCQWWLTIAHWQGRIVMNVLLSIVYFTLIVPAGWLHRRRHGTHPFHTWDLSPPTSASGWEPLPLTTLTSHHAHSKRRSLPWLLLTTIGFFYEQGHYVILPILIVLLALGLLLFFVQGSVLAPFIYTIF
jgi:Ca2+/Na+ antiporter